MPTNVVMPALELAQTTGKVLRWLKSPGDRVQKGEPLVEIETDKITTEIEAPVAGVLGAVTARQGDVVPVGQTIARIVESAPESVAVPPLSVGPAAASSTAAPASTSARGPSSASAPTSAPAAIKASPLARRIAEEHGVDLAQVKATSGKIEKADVLAYIESRQASGRVAASTAASFAAEGAVARPAAASPKARRLAAERGLDLTALYGSGPSGAVLADDVLAAKLPPAAPSAPPVVERPAIAAAVASAQAAPVGTVWRVMAERMTASWTTAPHFYLVREVNVSRLVSWRERAAKRTGAHVTYSDLLVKLVAATIAQRPNVNVSWRDGAIVRNADVNLGLAVAIDEGLIVPVIHRADRLSLSEIAARREDIVNRAQAGKLRPADIQGGGFTISNLGMYGVDAFNAILNPPQAAILAVGRIADRVTVVNGQPSVQPTMVLTLSGDHRAVDGARGAQFLGALADLIEEPLSLLV